jgi:hypothetical protein
MSAVNEPIQWACKACTYVQNASPGVYTCQICGKDHSNDTDILAILPKKVNPKPLEKPGSQFDPRQYNKFPGYIDPEDLKKYFSYNLSKLVPSLVPLEFTDQLIDIVSAYAIEDLYVGALIDAQDKMGKWYESTIRDTRDGKIYVHFNGWPHKWDEWLPYGSARICRVHTHTLGPYQKKIIPAIGDINSHMNNFQGPSTENINRIVAMGFSVEQATEALRTTTNDIQRAINILLNS